MDMILVLQYLLSILFLSAIVFALGLVKKRLLQFSVVLSVRAERKYRPH